MQMLVAATVSVSRKILLTSSSSSSLSSSISTIMEGVDLVHQKRALRSRIRRQLRLNFPPPLRLAEDVEIQRHVLEAPWYKSSRSVCAYISCESLREVDTSKILSDILQEENPEVAKKLYVPWVEDKASHMRLLHISTLKDLKSNSMNILEPTLTDVVGNAREDVMQANKPVDLILVPGLAFDRAGRRLGRGGGYYDMFLNNYFLLAEDKGWKPPLLVALAYSLQIIEGSVPVGATDVPVDAIVSSSGVFPVSPRALERM